MDQGKQVQAQLYNKNTRVLLRLQQSQKVVVQLDPDKNTGLQQRSSSAKPMKADHRTIHGGVYTRNKRFIKPDLTEAVLPKPRPEPKI